jgi:branched-chain amino acid:cation transporter, LIVCS family
MKQTTKKSHLWSTGFAMFSMLFGAGNIVFPLMLGQFAQDKNFFAILGLLVTAVGVPFLGLIGMTLFEGNYKSFFNRMGKIPGFLIAAIILALIGPFGAIPRCIALAYSTAQVYLPHVSLSFFSLIACLIIFLFTLRRARIIDLLGYVLTPLLLISLVIIIVKGLASAPETPVATHHELAIFIKGLTDGYQTMDLLGAFFFCSVVLVSLKKDVKMTDPQHAKQTLNLTLKASCIGASLLALIYIGFSYVAASYSHSLNGVSPDALITAVTLQVLGPYAGIVVCLAVTLACLTTVIALSSVFAEFLHKDICHKKIKYSHALIITLVSSFLVSTLDFNGIAHLLAPVLQLFYPALIVLTLLNILYKIYGFQPVKIPVLIVFGFSLFF